MAKSYKRIINMERAVRLESLGWRDAEIAKQLGLTPAGLAMVKQDPDYATIRGRILTGVLSKLDEDLVNDLEYQRHKLNSMLPVALDGLYELAVQTKNERVRLAACESIADRNGHLAKVTRMGLPTDEQGGVGKIDDETADALITALQAAKKQRESLETMQTSTDKVQ